jgi:pimeloyl-ACP methyl ester carboxylesterase
VPAYTDTVRALCDDLGIARVAAVVGTSAGGPTAVTMAARHPDLVERLILVSARGWLPYPDGRGTRAGARVVFHPAVERLTWGGLHALARRAPKAFLRLMLGSLSTLPASQVMASLRDEDRAFLLGLFAEMRSGRGFSYDLRETPDVTAQVQQPTLVVATRTDGGVSFAHALSLVNAIRGAQLVESRAPSHMVWFGADWPIVAEQIRAFLTREVRHP